MQVRLAGRIGISLALLGASGVGCGALGAATGGIQSTTSTVQDTTSTLDSAKGTVDSNRDKAKAENDKAKGKGGSGGSGGGDNDNSRAAAKECKVNEPLTDNVDPKKGDPVDWKVFDLAGRPGIATATVNWDDPAADLAIDVYNAYGEQMAASPPRGPSTAKKVLVQIPGPDKYYVKISSLKGASDYTASLRWANGSGGGGGSGGSSGSSSSSGGGSSVPPPQAGNQVPNPGAGAAGPPVGGAAPAAPGAGGAPVAAAAVGALPDPNDPMHPRCKIVQSFRGEDGKLTLYIDKGSSVGIRAGMSGYILDGKDEKKLDGGDFRISKVIDATHSVGNSGVAKVGKNNRCIIDTIKP